MITNKKYRAPVVEDFTDKLFMKNENTKKF